LDQSMIYQQFLAKVEEEEAWIRWDNLLKHTPKFSFCQATFFFALIFQTLQC
jgi:hypothetical protein